MRRPHGVCSSTPSAACRAISNSESTEMPLVHHLKEKKGRCPMKGEENEEPPKFSIINDQLSINIECRKSSIENCKLKIDNSNFYEKQNHIKYKRLRFRLPAPRIAR